jgi:hypothetical protein
MVFVVDSESTSTLYFPDVEPVLSIVRETVLLTFFHSSSRLSRCNSNVTLGGLGTTYHRKHEVS